MVKTMAILCRVAEHHLPNCSGFLSSSPSSFVESSSFAVFRCSAINAHDCPFPVQVFASKPPFEFVHFNGIFLQKQGLNVGDQVMLEQVNDVRYCQWMELMPESVEDWNIIESTSSVIEEEFLRQIRVVQQDLKFVLFLSQGVAVNLRVAQLGPNLPKSAAVLITNSTQVLVAQLGQAKADLHGNKSEVCDLIHENVSLNNPIRFFLSQDRLVAHLRVIRHLGLNDGFGQLSVVCIGKGSYVNVTLCKLESVLGFQSHVRLIKLPEVPNHLPDELHTIHSEITSYPPKHCLISSDLTNAIHPFEQIELTPLKSSQVQDVKSLIYSSSIPLSPEALKGALSRHLRNLQYAPVVVPRTGTELTVDGVDGHFKVSIVIPSEASDQKLCSYFLPDQLPTFIRSEKEVQLPTSPESKSLANLGQQPLLFEQFQSQTEFAAEMSKFLISALELESCLNALVYGEEFNGKSAALEVVARLLFKERAVFSCRIDCNEFKGKSPEVICQMLEPRLKMLNARAPAVLILDRFDFLNVNVEDEDRARLVSKTYYKIMSLTRRFRTPVLASASDKHSLNSVLNRDGERFFTWIKEVPVLSQDQKLAVLHQLLPQLQLRPGQLDAAHLHRLRLGDLVKLADTLRLKCNSGPIPEQVLQKAVGARVRLEAGTHKNNNNNNNTAAESVTFEQVGGMARVKQQLTQVFLWPTKYAAVFEQVGYRTGNAAVLFGPSGCGKTLVARALAEESKFNVTHVKGPELLSKYIGQSEENVRNLFEKARRSKPALIIFDEFDSLVPKRGHDNTGVTDRVVNQFLTELDGVDSAMEGVYVLATTNRIDLIDDALLRPGRFDHKVLVDYPDQSDRLEILQIHCKDIELAEDVDLDELALKTEGWTSTELRGLVVNAAFEASREESARVGMGHLLRCFDQSLQAKTKKAEEQTFRMGERVTLA